MAQKSVCYQADAIQFAGTGPDTVRSSLQGVDGLENSLRRR